MITWTNKNGDYEESTCGRFWVDFIINDDSGKPLYGLYDENTGTSYWADSIADAKQIAENILQNK